MDHGKSTLMGRLLYDLKVVDQRTIDKLRKEAESERKTKARGRRASAKLGFGAKGGKKRKASDDSDDSEFAVKKPKAAPNSKGGGLLSMKYDSKPAGVTTKVNGVEQMKKEALREPTRGASAQ